jgi:hypothetical protein
MSSTWATTLSATAFHSSTLRPAGASRA